MEEALCDVLLPQPYTAPLSQQISPLRIAAFPAFTRAFSSTSNLENMSLSSYFTLERWKKALVPGHAAKIVTAADHTPNFNYKPLEPRCIRILELQPGNNLEPFQGRFINVSIDRKSPKFEYDALSYMWGNSTPVDVILVDGASIPIAANLTMVLRHLRNLKAPIPLRIWIDAVCINQDDLNERGHQVAMMRLVYRNATCVRIWINEPGVDGHSAAVAALKQFRLDEKQEHHGLGGDPSFWDPVVPIFRNGYWNRMWM